MWNNFSLQDLINRKFLKIEMPWLDHLRELSMKHQSVGFIVNVYGNGFWIWTDKTAECYEKL